MRATDLAPIIGAPPPDGVGYRQGIILTFNPFTLENTVDVDGEVFTNLPILGVGEAATLVAGATVGIHTTRRLWYIIGRIVTPATQAATDAVSLLSAKTKTAVVSAQEATTSVTFVDLATVGPEVEIVIGPSGRALLILHAIAGWIHVAADAADGAHMSVELSGANTAAATVGRDATLATQFGDTSFNSTQGSITGVFVLDSLNTGATTFTAKYRSRFAGNTVDFAWRSITVIAL